MLSLSKKRGPRKRTGVLLTATGLLLVGGGLYVFSLVTAPVIMPALNIVKPIDPAQLAKPDVKDNRIIIPKIGVNIAYGKGKYALDHGAEWRYPERGDPVDGGNFIIAAHRFTLAATPAEVAVKSPFYHIDKLTKGDQIIIDYDGKRYGYTIDQTLQVAPDQVEIEDKSDTPKLTLYSCTLGGSRDGRLVLVASPMGEVTVTSDGNNDHQL